MRRTDLRSARKLVRLNRGGLKIVPKNFQIAVASRFLPILSDSSDFFSDFDRFFFQIIIIPYYSLLGEIDIP